MLIYIVELIIGIIMCYIIQYKKLTKKSKKIFLGLIILMLSFVGGFRALNIGTDVSVYGKKYFELAVQSKSLSSYLKIFSFAEYGYLFLNFVVSRFTSNINIFLLVLQLMCNSLILITLYKYKEKCPLWMSFCFYFCFYYGITFNIMRQCCALSLIFFSIRYLEEKKIIKYFIMIYIAFLFHSTAIIAGIFIYAIYLICNMKNKNKILFIFLILASLTIIVFGIKNFMKIAYSFGIINERIYNYIYVFFKENINISWGELFYKIFFVLIAIYTFNKKNTSKRSFALVCVLIDFILFQLKVVISYADRFSFYFGYLNILFIPQCFNAINLKTNKKNVINIVYFIICLLYFIYKYIYLGCGQIYPYEFNF